MPEEITEQLPTRKEKHVMLASYLELSFSTGEHA
jgi:hypothetical protein